MDPTKLKRKQEPEKSFTSQKKKNDDKSGQGLLYSLQYSSFNCYQRQRSVFYHPPMSL